ncbi:prolyl oligopeptidase family serine peptidase [Calidithermus roseus]|uniref:Dipeptidyl aminopeptidase BI n=1 Tax=Calidithermus roseus TaxID=1644118 RepID=A0A399EKY7_9DEIN|nr:prolyl oligopeptidase family serine peptidase [Calidithermus roseus]RIH84113.1 Dipeptidyl aminopeptidase BI [Calidithermus roseus]
MSDSHNPKPDEFAWLEDLCDPRTRRFLEDENTRVERFLAGHVGLYRAVISELMALRSVFTESPAMPIGNYLYYDRTDSPDGWPVFCRRRVGTLEEEVLVDVGELASERGSLHAMVGSIKPNDDHSKIALSIDLTGHERYTVLVRDLENGRFLEEIPDVYADFEWSPDGKGLYLLGLSESGRPERLLFRPLGPQGVGHQTLLVEPNEHYALTLARSRSRAYLFVTSVGAEDTEVHYLELDRPNRPVQLFYQRRERLRYWLEHCRDRFAVLTNLDRTDLRVMFAPCEPTPPEGWIEALSPAEGVVSGMDAFASHLVIYGHENGCGRIWVHDLAQGETWPIPAPEAGVPEGLGVFSPAENGDYHARWFRFEFSSLVTPEGLWEVDLETRSVRLVHRHSIPGYDSGNYCAERVWAETDDGSAIPISLVYRHGCAAGTVRPLYLYVYGAYGAVTSPSFSPFRLPLLDRGVAFAIGHIRGGGERGQAWHDGGRRLNKRNAALDVIACAQHLIREGYACPDSLVLAGVSAGGAAVGAALNARPDLFRAVVARVPFVDVVGGMLDETSALSALETAEWGDPDAPDELAYMFSYSPYQNLKPGRYPAILAVGAMNDTRVPYWMPAKWVARIRSYRTGRNRLLLKTHLDTGHLGAGNLIDELEDAALEWAFVLACVGRDTHGDIAEKATTQACP